MYFCSINVSLSTIETYQGSRLLCSFAADCWYRHDYSCNISCVVLKSLEWWFRVWNAVAGALPHQHHRYILLDPKFRILDKIILRSREFDGSTYYNSLLVQSACEHDRISTHTQYYPGISHQLTWHYVCVYTIGLAILCKNSTDWGVLFMGFASLHFFQTKATRSHHHALPTSEKNYPYLHGAKVLQRSMYLLLYLHISLIHP